MPSAALLATTATLAFGADPYAPVLVHDARERSPASRVERFAPWLFYADNLPACWRSHWARPACCSAGAARSAPDRDPLGAPDRLRGL